MYGLINVAVRDFIGSSYGANTWATIVKALVSDGTVASKDALVFHEMEQYPDSITVALLDKAAATIGTSPEELMTEVGRYWVAFTSHKGYGDIVDLLGPTFEGALLHLNEMHSRLRTQWPALRPPAFTCSDVSPNELTLHYYSMREGLDAFVRGLIVGLAEAYGRTVSLTQVSGVSAGAKASFRIRHVALGEDINVWPSPRQCLVLVGAHGKRLAHFVSAISLLSPAVELWIRPDFRPWSGLDVQAVIIADVSSGLPTVDMLKAFRRTTSGLDAPMVVAGHLDAEAREALIAVGCTPRWTNLPSINELASDIRELLNLGPRTGATG